MASNPALLRTAGLIGLVGAVTPIVTDIISWLLAENYSPIAHSISNLAVGSSSWLMDIGLWVFALGCVAVAVGLWTWRVRAKWWHWAIIALVLLAVCVGVIARVNEYAGQQNQGANIHFWAVIGVGLLFVATTWLAAPGLGTMDDGLARFSRVLSVVFLVLAIFYWFFAPNDWSGAVERLLALMMLAWIGRVASRLRRSGERAV